MPTYVAFLRAVNVGKRKYPMAELRAALDAAGYAGVETHIQTGNVLLTTPVRSRAKLEKALEEVFEQDRGFVVHTVVLTPRELTQVAGDADEIAGTSRVEDHGHPDETVVVRGRAVHLLYAKPYHEAKVSNVQVEKALGIATNRNAKVIRALAEKWGA